jgi:pimeloyl-ACP methyl ester carboxylesterase
MPSDSSVQAETGRPRRLRRLTAGVAAAGAVATALVAGTIAFRSGGNGDERETPDVAALAGPLADQELAWEACEFNDDGPPLPGADLSNVECATIQVPRDWHDPDPEVTWDVRISQARNIDPANPDYRTTIITHPGGPYASGLSYSTTVQMYTPELRPTTNYVSFDQRGLGQSSHAECEYEYEYAPDDGRSAEARAIGEACSQDADVATMTTEQAAYDMDFIRHLLGLESVTYMGYSYRTSLGTWFGSLFSDNIERMVLDSATDSTQESIQTLYNAAHEGRDRQFRLHMMNWIARNDATFGLGSDPETIWKRYFAATNAPEQSLAARYAWNSVNGPVAFSNPVAYPAAGSLVSSIIAEGETPTDPVVPAESAARIIDRTDLPDELRAAAHERLARLADAPVHEPGETVRGTHDYKRTADIAPLTAQLGLLVTPTCAFWPTDSTMPPLDDSFPETIVLQSELDSMTPFEQGWAAGTGLPNTSLIAVDNESIHGVSPYGTEEVDRPVIDFLLSGDRPARTIAAAGKAPTPGAVHVRVVDAARRERRAHHRRPSVHRPDHSR